MPRKKNCLSFRRWLRRAMRLQELHGDPLTRRGGHPTKRRR